MNTTYCLGKQSERVHLTLVDHSLRVTRQLEPVTSELEHFTPMPPRRALMAAADGSARRSHSDKRNLHAGRRVKAIKGCSGREGTATSSHHQKADHQRSHISEHTLIEPKNAGDEDDAARRQEKQESALRYLAVCEESRRSTIRYEELQARNELENRLFKAWRTGLLEEEDPLDYAAATYMNRDEDSCSRNDGLNNASHTACIADDSQTAEGPRNACVAEGPVGHEVNQESRESTPQNECITAGPHADDQLANDDLTHREARINSLVEHAMTYYPSEDPVIESDGGADDLTERVAVEQPPLTSSQRSPWDDDDESMKRRKQMAECIAEELVQEYVLFSLLFTDGKNEAEKTSEAVVSHNTAVPDSPRNQSPSREPDGTPADSQERISPTRAPATPSTQRKPRRDADDEQGGCLC